MNEIVIEKGIEIPESNPASGRGRKYPWDKMEVGDSIFIPGRNSNKFSMHTAYSKRHGVRFTARTVEGGLRIWRVK